VPVARSRKAVERIVRDRLTDWRGLLTTNVQDGRELLRRTLAGPLRFTAEDDGYRFEGDAAIGRVLEGVIAMTPFVASPGGFRGYGRPVDHSDRGTRGRGLT
jgi:hypothetical protein